MFFFKTKSQSYEYVTDINSEQKILQQIGYSIPGLLWME